MTKHIHIHLHRRAVDRKVKDAAEIFEYRGFQFKKNAVNGKWYVQNKRSFSNVTLSGFATPEAGKKYVDENFPANDCAAKDEASWVEVRRSMFEQITVGKTYMLNGRKGKVVEKSESGGKNAAGISTGGNPMIKVEWKTGDSYTTAEKNEYYKIEAEHSDLAQKREDLSDKGRSLNAADVERMKVLEKRMKELHAKMNKVGDASEPLLGKVALKLHARLSYLGKSISGVYTRASLSQFSDSDLQKILAALEAGYKRGDWSDTGRLPGL